MAITVRVLVTGACLLTLAACHSAATSASGLTSTATVSAVPTAAATPLTSPTLVSKVPLTASPSKMLSPPATAIKTLPPITLPCKTSQLSVEDDTNQGAAGTLVEEFSLHNTSSSTCRIIGRPQISPYGMLTQGSSKVEANLDVTVNPIPSGDTQIGGPATTVQLTHGDYAIFFLKWSHIPSGSGSCDDADGFDFQAPSDSIQKLITFAFTVCDGEVEVSNTMDKTNGFPPN